MQRTAIIVVVVLALALVGVASAASSSGAPLRLDASVSNAAHIAPKKHVAADAKPVRAQAKVKSSSLALASSNIASSTGILDTEVTCFASTGYPATPQVSWSGAPSATASYALAFYQTSESAGASSHVFWFVYNIDSSVSAIDYNTTVGTVGLDDTNVVGYYAPCAGGGGERVFYMTLYALNTEVFSGQSASTVNYAAFLDLYTDAILDQTTLTTVYNKDTDGSLAMKRLKKRKL